VSDTSACAIPDGNQPNSEKSLKPSTKKRGGRPKLQDRQRIEIVKMLAEFIPQPQIVYEIKRKYGIELSQQSIYGYSVSPKWKDKLLKLRKKYTDDLESVPGYHKRVRMERMEKIWEKADNKSDLKSAVTVTEHQRKEVEGDGTKQSGDNILIQFNAMSDAELQKEFDNTLEYVKRLEEKRRKIIDIGGPNGQGIVTQS
jgi:hypothetical protein